MVRHYLPDRVALGAGFGFAELADGGLAIGAQKPLGLGGRGARAGRPRCEDSG